MMSKLLIGRGEADLDGVGRRGKRREQGGESREIRFLFWREQGNFCFGEEGSVVHFEKTERQFIKGRSLEFHS